MIRTFLRFYFRPTAKNYKKLRRAAIRRQHAYEEKQALKSIYRHFWT